MEATPLTDQHRQRSMPIRIAEPMSVLALSLATSQALRALVGLKLAPLGLAAGQDRFLKVLDEKGPLSVSGLADELNVRPSTISKMLDRLQARGYATRTDDDLDARRVSVGLTEEGRAICGKLRVLCETIEAELKADLDQGDLKQMVAGLATLNDAVDRRLKRLR